MMVMAVKMILKTLMMITMASDSTPDDCLKGVVGWTSDSSTDHDSDGCKDDEDLDDDNDGVFDNHPDVCTSTTSPITWSFN